MAAETQHSGEVSAPSDRNKTGIFSGLQEVSLKLAGYLYLAGDASLLAFGILRPGNEHKSLLQRAGGAAGAGAIWSLGGLAAARYANESAARQTDRIGYAMGDYLRGRGIEISGEATLLTQPRGLVQKLEDFAYRHPAELLNGAYAVGSVSLMRSKGHNDRMMGYLVGAGSALGLLLPEAKDDPDQEKPKGFIEKAKDFIKHPLRFSGLLYLANNWFTLQNGIEAMKNSMQGGKRNWSFLLAFVTAGCYMVANVLVAISSRSREKDQAPLNLEPLEKALAEVVAKQPAEAQALFAQDLAEQMTKQSGVTVKAEALAQNILSRVQPTAAQQEVCTGEPCSKKWTPEQGQLSLLDYAAQRTEGMQRQ